jgi:mRNA interferase RelE/StbE
MNVEFSKSFDKQTSRISDKILLKRLGNIIKKVIKCDTLNEIPNLKSIVGHPGFYRIRLGDYRIGISLEEETVWFHFFGKRDDSTYKKFP